LKKRGLAASKPIEVIEINLMTGMNVVRFIGSGKMFCPPSSKSQNEKSSSLFIAIY
jgi:5-methyltetrahydrofolate--homocysteine methyltransferase